MRVTCFAVPIRVGHSAAPDDAFMVWALEAGKVDTRGLELEPVASDIQTLNEWALEGRLEVTALSAGAYPAVADRYVPLPLGLVAIRRDVDRAADVSAVLREAIDVALANRGEALDYARAFGRGIDA